MVITDEDQRLPVEISDEMAHEFFAHVHELGREGVPIAWVMVFRLEDMPFSADAIRAVIDADRDLAEKIWQRRIYPDYW